MLFRERCYADDDQDGLPTWFEMDWFGKFLAWSTATGLVELLRTVA